MTLSCQCPSTDAIECLQLRHGLNLDEALIEPCRCDCHKPENQQRTIYEEEEDAFYDKLRQALHDNIRASHDRHDQSSHAESPDHWWMPFWNRGRR